MMEAASTSEMSVNFYQTTWRYNPEDSYLHTCCYENLKSYNIEVVTQWMKLCTRKMQENYKQTVSERKKRTKENKRAVRVFNNNKEIL
jgi:hypothetical protein